MLKSCIDCWLCRRECSELLARFSCFTFVKAAVSPVPEECVTALVPSTRSGFTTSVPVKLLKQYLVYNLDMKLSYKCHRIILMLEQ